MTCSRATTWLAAMALWALATAVVFGPLAFASGPKQGTAYTGGPVRDVAINGVVVEGVNKVNFGVGLGTGAEAHNSSTLDYNAAVIYSGTSSAAAAKVLNTLTVPQLSTFKLHADCAAVKSDGSAGAGYEVTGTFYRGTSTTVTQAGSTTALATHESDSSWVGVTLVTASAGVTVKMNGKASTNITWHCAESAVVSTY